MNTWIILLRGVNVSGSNLIKMTELKADLEKAGFQQVQTYIQSGNIILQTKEKDAMALEKFIADRIRKKFGYEVSVFAKTTEYLQDAIDSNPFSSRNDFDEKRLYFCFLEKEPAEEVWKAIDREKYKPEEIEFHGSMLYFYSPLGMGKAKMSNNFFEQKLKQKATTRNWNTMHKLIEMASH